MKRASLGRCSTSTSSSQTGCDMARISASQARRRASRGTPGRTTAPTIEDASKMISAVALRCRQPALRRGSRRSGPSPRNLLLRHLRLRPARPSAHEPIALEHRCLGQHILRQLRGVLRVRPATRNVLLHRHAHTASKYSTEPRRSRSRHHAARCSRVSETIRPEAVVRAEGESAAAYTGRQALTVELWSIPVNQRTANRIAASLKGQ
jgi:hypothetical protein